MEDLNNLFRGQCPMVHDGELERFRHNIRNSVLCLSLRAKTSCWRTMVAPEVEGGGTIIHHFFIKLSRVKKTIKRITLVMIGLQEDTSFEDIKTFIMEVFKERFQSKKRINVNHWEARFLCLDQWKANTLEIPFTMEEIRYVMKGADENKSLGPDGFTHGSLSSAFGQSLSLKRSWHLCLTIFMR